MSKNLIFYFSGTGNCLKLSKDIANALLACEIISMGRNERFPLDHKYDSIGFVYPTYFWGIPTKVADFISKLDFGVNQSTYIYAIATYGAIAGNALKQVNMLLNVKDVQLSYGKRIKMFSNYIVFHDMSQKVEEITKKSDMAITTVIDDLINKRIKSVGKLNRIFEWYYRMKVKSVPTIDKDYSVSDNCISCAICEKVCPVGNIEIENGKPVFRHHCEQCLACIQYCPKRAINYKNITQSRRRYTNPSISYKELNSDETMQNGIHVS